MESDHKQLRHDFAKVITGVLKHSEEIKSMQSEVSGFTAMVQEIRNAILPNAPPILPHFPVAVLQIADDLSSLQSTARPAPLSPPCKKVNRGDESPSSSLHRTTGIHKLSPVQA
jgi:hypothetical protein